LKRKGEDHQRCEKEAYLPQGDAGGDSRGGAHQAHPGEQEDLMNLFMDANTIVELL